MRLAHFALAAASTAFWSAAPVLADPVVVELYTSQGCSSCPPADEMMGQLSGRDDVIALSLHVDYWDWIGWADTFANPAFSDRQRAYASAAGSSVVYTPQFIVGGRDQVAGAAGMQLADLIEAQRGATGDVLRVASSAEGPTVMAMATGEAGQLVLVTILPEARVTILHGENAGREMTYHNIVTGWDVLSEWSGEEIRLLLPPAPADHAQVVIAQTLPGGRPGPILGAVRVD